MDFSNLKAFYQVVVSGNFSKAAEDMFISQPALSRQIAALEKELDLQLFHRQGRNITLTDAGRRLFVYAEKITSLYKEAKKEMLELKDLATGELEIGASTTIANYILPSILADYHKKHPNIKIHLYVGNSTRIEEMVLENKVDIGLIAGQSQNPRIYQETFTEDEIYLITPNHHRLSEDDDNFLDLGQETFLCRENGSDTQRLLNEMFKELSLTLPKTIILGDTEAIKRGVINNMGIAFLSKHTFVNELKLGLVKCIENTAIKRPLQLIYQKGSRLSPSSLAFSSFLKKLEIPLNMIK